MKAADVLKIKEKAIQQARVKDKALQRKLAHKIRKGYLRPCLPLPFMIESLTGTRQGGYIEKIIFIKLRHRIVNTIRIIDLSQMRLKNEN